MNLCIIQVTRISDEPNNQEEQLDEEQLEEVAGGFKPSFIGMEAPSTAYPIEHGIVPKTLEIDGKKLQEGLLDPTIKPL